MKKDPETQETQETQEFKLSVQDIRKLLEESVCLVTLKTSAGKISIRCTRDELYVTDSGKIVGSQRRRETTSSVHMFCIDDEAWRTVPDTKIIGVIPL